MHLPLDTLLKGPKGVLGLDHLEAKLTAWAQWIYKSKVNTLIPADASGPTVLSTNTGTQKIDGSILKPFSIVQAIKLGEKSLPGDFISLSKLYQVSINIFT